MDYKEIGQRIRAIRKRNYLSQEKLAEAADVGTAHISHIETGHTKMSVQVLVSICNALDVSADEILCGHVYQSKEALRDDMARLLGDCSSNELYVLTGMIEHTKASLRKVYKKD